MLNLAFRNVVRQKLRAAMILGAVTFGVAALIVIGGFVQDMFAQLAEKTIRSRTGHIQIAQPGYFGAGSRSPEKYLLPHLQELKSTVARNPAVREAMARIQFSALLNNTRSDFPVLVEGIEPGKEAGLATQLLITQGRNLRDDDTFAIVLGEGVAKSLRLRPGERANLLAATGDGAMNLLEFEVVGLFRSISRDHDARAVRIPLRAAQELLGTDGANVVVALLRHTGETPAVANALAQELSGAALDVRRWDEIDDFYPKAVVLYERQFAVLRIVVLAMVFLSVFNAVNMSVLERAGEFGIMRALGNRSRQVFLSVVTEGFLLGMAGAFLGCILGLALAVGISAVGIPMPAPPNSNVGYTASIAVVPSVLAGAFLVGLLATVLASVLPARRVSRLAIVDALRQIV
jgi:putative ABC transport system permease protein